jgi:hypothetical protein
VKTRYEPDQPRIFTDAGNAHRYNGDLQ